MDHHTYIQNRIGSLSTPGGSMDRFKRRALNLLVEGDFRKSRDKNTGITLTV